MTERTWFERLLGPLSLTLLLLDSSLFVHLFAVVDKKAALGVSHLREIIFEVFAEP
jgi:hypothetical protein